MNCDKTVVDKHWNYSAQAEYYKFRPNYCDKAVDALVHHVGAVNSPGYRVADIGAGTGNLTVMLLERGLNVTAVEPNEEMRREGIARTSGSKRVKWVAATGVATTLKNGSVDWATFGSSFNVVDRDQALRETHRILRKDGYFTCVWNHRSLEDPVQRTAEGIIIKLVPGYDRGVRREDQRPVLEKNRRLFRDIFYLEMDFEVARTIGDYINAWKSVRNKYWDVDTAAGAALFRRICDRMREKLPGRFNIGYTVRAWTARKAAP